MASGPLDRTKTKQCGTLSRRVRESNLTLRWELSRKKYETYQTSASQPVSQCSNKTASSFTNAINLSSVDAVPFASAPRGAAPVSYWEHSNSPRRLIHDRSQRFETFPPHPDGWRDGKTDGYEKVRMTTTFGVETTMSTFKNDHRSGVRG